MRIANNGMGTVSTGAAHDTRSRRLRDIDTAFRVHGSGQRVVFIHGLGQDHSIWISLQTSLSDHHTLAYDLRGHGATSLGNGEGTIDQLGEDLIALLEWFGRATLVGFSLGGVVALWVASERPDLVDTVVAVATSSVVGRAAADGLDTRVKLFEASDRAAIEQQLLEDTRLQLANPSVDAEAVTATRVAAIADPAGYVNGARAVRRMREEPLNDRLERITLPVLVVSGTRDLWCPRRAAEIMLDHLGSARIVDLDGVGHLVMDDAPERLAAVVVDWLTNNETA
jgi:pimeloyl-ACP methyl ester carboxylesterase